MYTTLARVRAELKMDATVTTDDPLILGYIQTVTSRIRHAFNEFEPQYGVEYFTAQAQHVSLALGGLNLVNHKGQRLLLASSTDVPSIVSDGVTLVYNSDVYADPRDTTPIRRLRLNETSTAWSNTWYPAGQQLLDSIVITGWWGYRRNYASEGWLPSGDSVQDAAGITASATTISVTSVGGQDYYFQTPRFSPGNLIRIEDEMCLVWAVNTTTNTLSVRRGVNGSTAAAHAMGAAISLWYPEDDVVRVATRQAAYLYARRGAFEQIVTDGVATAIYPRDLVAELYATIQGFMNE
jgi:hypothetical protein